MTGEDRPDPSSLRRSKRLANMNHLSPNQRLQFSFNLPNRDRHKASSGSKKLGNQFTQLNVASSSKRSNANQNVREFLNQPEQLFEIQESKGEKRKRRVGDDDDDYNPDEGFE